MAATYAVPAVLVKNDQFPNDDVKKFGQGRTL